MADKIIGWEKLNHKCFICEKEYSDILFTFKCTKPFPGTRVESYHWACLPVQLKSYQANSEAEMLEAAQQPFR